MVQGQICCGSTQRSFTIISDALFPNNCLDIVTHKKKYMHMYYNVFLSLSLSLSCRRAERKAKHDEIRRKYGENNKYGENTSLSNMETLTNLGISPSVRVPSWGLP